MEYWIICLLIIGMIAVLYGVVQVKLKEIKKRGEKKQLNKITDAYPSNVQIAKSILKKLGNETVQIEENKQREASFYFVATNRIIISNQKNLFTRIQTIAHECIHSTQSKSMLWFHFLYSNFLNLYFVLLLLFTLLGMVQNGLFQMVLLLLFAFAQYFVRSFLEIDAMTRARYVAAEYMEEEKSSSKEDRQKVLQEYDELNQLGIKTVCFELFCSGMLKVWVYGILLCMIHF